MFSVGLPTPMYLTRLAPLKFLAVLCYAVYPVDWKNDGVIRRTLSFDIGIDRIHSATAPNCVWPHFVENVGVG